MLLEHSSPFPVPTYKRNCWWDNWLIKYIDWFCTFLLAIMVKWSHLHTASDPSLQLDVWMCSLTPPLFLLVLDQQTEWADARPAGHRSHHVPNAHRWEHSHPAEGEVRRQDAANAERVRKKRLSVVFFSPCWFIMTLIACALSWPKLL